MKVKYSEPKAIPEGTYLARLDGLEETTHPQFGKTIKWTFTIMGPQQYANTTVTAMSSTKVSPKSKMFAWLQAFGVILGENDEFELNDLLGKMCKVRIKNTTKVAVVDGQERSTTYSNVNAIAAYVPPAQGTIQTPTAQTQQLQTQQPQTQQVQSPTQQVQPQTQQPPTQQVQQTQPNNVVPQQNLADDEEFDF